MVGHSGQGQSIVVDLTDCPNETSICGKEASSSSRSETRGAGTNHGGRGSSLGKRRNSGRSGMVIDLTADVDEEGCASHRAAVVVIGESSGASSSTRGITTAQPTNVMKPPLGSADDAYRERIQEQVKLEEKEGGEKDSGNVPLFFADSSLQVSSPCGAAPGSQPEHSVLGGMDNGSGQASCQSCGCTDESAVLIICGCSHPTCGPCLRMAVGLDSKGDGGRADIDRGKVKGCVRCGNKFREQDMQQCMTREEMDDVMQKLTIMFLDNNPDVVHCPGAGCQARIMRNTEEVDVKKIVRTAPCGVELTKRMAIHMHQHRLRCPDCGTNFCGSCLAVPYHVNMNCDQHKEMKEARPCRFCSGPLPPKAKAGAVCGSADCKESLANVCDVRHRSCKHLCVGVFGETKCPPCLECAGEADEFCGICWTDALKAAPVIQLTCKHYLHLKCVVRRLEKRWPTAKISFNFAKCPLCKVWVEHSQLKKQMKEVMALRKTVLDSAMERLKLEGGDKDKEALQKHNGEVESLALAKYNYYLCKKCSRPYFGGMAACGDAVANDGAAREGEGERADELMCGKCSGAMLGMQGMNCSKHGDQYVEFKCRYCCQIATFFCFGHTHFCDSCHKKWVSGAFKNPQSLVQPCKCKVKHAANGITQASEVCFGCSLCRIKSTDQAPL